MTPPASHRVTRFGEDGISLMEMMIVCMLMATVMAVAVPSVNAFYNDSTAVSRTYGVVDQVVPATETLSRYLRQAVQPASGSAPFLDITTATLDVGGVDQSAPTDSTSASFYANTGNGTGPELVLAALNTTTRTFTMTMTVADSNSCPVTGSSGTACTYTKGPVHHLLTIANVTNGSTAVFTYTLQGGSTTSSPSSAQLSEIVAVSVFIQAQLLPGNATGFQTLVYLLSPTYQTWVG